MQFIFDLDGTLLDSQEGVLFSLEYVLNKHAPEYIPSLDRAKTDTNIPLIGPPIIKIFEGFIPDPKVVSLLSKKYRLHYDSCGFLKTKLFPGVYQGLQELSKDNTILVSTNKPSVPTKKIFDLLKINNFIHNTITIDSGNFRNKSDIVKKILSTNNKNNSVVIGDSFDDYESAKNNGVDFIYCSYGYGYIDYTNQSFTTVNNPEALFKVLKRL
jgi:phosphoglycolate phosphatase